MSDGGVPVAVVIPTLDEAGLIAPLLRMLTAMDFAEIVVADGGSRDGTVAMIKATPGVRLVQCARGRGIQINAGVAATSAPIVLVLHADTRLPHDGPELIRASLADPAVAAGCFRLGFDVHSPLLAVFAWFSRFETSLTTFGDQAFFFRRAAFEAIGGAPGWPFLEDVALRERLRCIGRFVKRPEVVVTSARRFTKLGPARTQLRNMLILACYRCGIPVNYLARAYGIVR